MCGVDRTPRVAAQPALGGRGTGMVALDSDAMGAGWRGSPCKEIKAEEEFGMVNIMGGRVVIASDAQCVYSTEVVVGTRGTGGSERKARRAKREFESLNQAALPHLPILSPLSLGLFVDERCIASTRSAFDAPRLDLCPLCVVVTASPHYAARHSFVGPKLDWRNQSASETNYASDILCRRLYDSNKESDSISDNWTLSAVTMNVARTRRAVGQRNAIEI